MNKKIITIGLIIVLSTTVFSGCVDENEKENNQNNNAKTYTINTNYPRDRLGLNAEGEAAFTAACEKYTELQSIMTDNEARNALVNELNSGFEFVKESSLSEDGYTIAVIFEDDTAALMITDDGLFTNSSTNTGSQFSYFDENIIIGTNSNSKNKIIKITEKEKILAPLASEIDASNNCGEVNFIVPQSKKVLIINAASLCEPYWSGFEKGRVIEAFEEQGWNINDIDILERNSYYDGKITPDDFFDFSDYGIVTYVGHGGYCSDYEGSIPGHHYIECCNYVDFTSDVGKERNDQYLIWRDQGRLLTAGVQDENKEWIWEYYIDTDLIKENAKIDPATIVYTTSCNSYRVSDAYLSNDAGCFFGWDGKTDSKSSGNAFYDLIKTMANEDDPQTAADALNQLSIEVRTSDTGGGVLQIYDNGEDIYLPSWGTISISSVEIPDDTDHFEIEIQPYGKPKIFNLNLLEEIDIDGLAPTETSITIRVIDSADNIIETGIFTPDLKCGKNEIIIHTWSTYGIKLETSPKQVKPDGEETSTITATVQVWNDGDILEPTGDVLPCKSIEFFTNLGTFTGLNPVVSDADGKATIQISSTSEGKAKITAFIEDDRIEATIYVEFQDGWSYFEDFQGEIGTEWSHTDSEISPSSQRFLGKFTTEEVTLHLTDLPAHSRIILESDFIAIGPWQGDSGRHAWDENGKYIGNDDQIWIKLNGDPNWEGHIWARNFPTIQEKDYIGGFDENDVINTLGYTTDPISIKLDTGETMEIERGDGVFSWETSEIAHSEDEIEFVFVIDESGFSGPSDVNQYWGIDNVAVTLI